jgi:hypothetical protein
MITKTEYDFSGAVAAYGISFIHAEEPFTVNIRDINGNIQYREVEVLGYGSGFIEIKDDSGMTCFVNFHAALAVEFVTSKKRGR